MRPMSDLPDVPGFVFMGIDREGMKFPCVVRMDPEGDGVCEVYTPNGTPCSAKLAGWVPSSGTSCSNV